MDSDPVNGRDKKKRQMSHAQSAASPAKSQNYDVLCIVFSLLDLFDLVHCSVVCKFWNSTVNQSRLLEGICLKIKGSSALSTKCLSVCLEDIAMDRHSLSLRKGAISVRQWRGHSLGVNQCRMKMGELLTGVGDKVMRLWSLQNYKCIEEYPMPDSSSLVDFDFDETKIVGLLGTRICIWRRNGARSIFPTLEGTFPRALCMRYFDPEAVVGCEDGTARVFDMYSKKCSRIIRLNSGPLTCLCLSDDQLIISGSSLGSVCISGVLSNQQVTRLRSRDATDLRALCFNPKSHLVFAGSMSGQTTCWDLRTTRILWERRVSPNVVYSLGHQRNDASTLVVGGIDGVVRFVDQNTGEVTSSIVLGRNTSSSQGEHDVAEGRRMAEDFNIDNVSRSFRPQITCLAVGMKKVVTTHNSRHIRIWNFA